MRVTTLIRYYCGKVIDLIVKISYCAACARWKNKTDPEEYREWFKENHKGSSGAMEVETAKQMFSRSEACQEELREKNEYYERTKGFVYGLGIAD